MMCGGKTKSDLLLMHLDRIKNWSPLELGYLSVDFETWESRTKLIIFDSDVLIRQYRV
jgi:hypothetical protein